MTGHCAERRAVNRVSLQSLSTGLVKDALRTRRRTGNNRGTLYKAYLPWVEEVKWLKVVQCENQRYDEMCARFNE